jgi:hypothetical protein
MSVEVNKVNNAHQILRDQFESLLNSNDVKIDVVRHLMNLQALKQDTDDAIEHVRRITSQTKQKVAAAIADNLIKPDLELFAAEWNVSDLLVVLLPQRDWNAWLKTLAAKLDALELPPSAVPLQIKDGHTREHVLKRLDTMQRLFRAKVGDYERKKRAAAADGSNSGKKSRTQPEADIYCRECGSKQGAGDKFCGQCGKKK